MLATKPARLRPIQRSPTTLEEHQELKELTVKTILLMAGSRADGKSSREMDLAERTGILVIAIKREQRLLLHRLAETTLLANDLVYCIGKKTDLEIGSEWFDPSISKD